MLLDAQNDSPRRYKRLGHHSGASVVLLCLGGGFLMVSACLTCRHARKPKSAEVGQAVCVFTGNPVAVFHVCASFQSLLGGAVSVLGGEALHHVQVNSGVEFHYGTGRSEKPLGFGVAF